MSDDVEKYLDWVEKAAQENIKGHIQAADELKKECNVTLTVLLAGATGALAYAAKSFEDSGKITFALAALALSITLFVLSGATLFKCLRIGDFPPPTNEPERLMERAGNGFQSLRLGELQNIQERIKEAKARNGYRAWWLNWIRLLAVLSPLVPVICFLLLYWANPAAR